MKVLALDLGDKWTGVAISDALRITGRPLTTIETQNIIPFLEMLLQDERIDTILLGYPKTLKGTESKQTIKTKEQGNELKNKFPSIAWVWWDERLTSKQAEQLMRPKTKEDKLASHAVAAALLLLGYLDSLQLQKEGVI